MMIGSSPDVFVKRTTAMPHGDDEEGNPSDEGSSEERSFLSKFSMSSNAIFVEIADSGLFVSSFLLSVHPK